MFLALASYRANQSMIQMRVVVARLWYQSEQWGKDSGNRNAQYAVPDNFYHSRG